MEQDRCNAEDEDERSDDPCPADFSGTDIAGKSADENTGDHQTCQMDTDLHEHDVADRVEPDDHVGDTAAEQMEERHDREGER